MAYPIFVLVIAVIVVAVVMVYAMPKLAEVFSEFGSDLPGITRLLISVSDFFGKYWYIVLGIILLIIVAFKVIRHFPGGRQELDRLKLKMPIFGVLTTASCSADFASTLVILLRAGVNLSDALSTVASTIKNSYYSMATEKLSDALAKGTPISYEMTKYECFPPVLTQMVYVGEDSNIEETLSTIGDYYADESERISNSLAAKLEPVMLVGIAFIACFIVFGIYLPMFQMYDLFG
jgi:type IV pilus assembly protein PilC